MSTKDVYVVSRQNGEVVSKKVRASPYEFTIATRAKWELVISDEDIEMHAGEYRKIRVQEITLNPETLVIPCSFTYHNVVSTLKVALKEGTSVIEKTRHIHYAYVFAQETGKVREGELIGVLNIFPIMFTREAVEPVILK